MDNKYKIFVWWGIGLAGVTTVVYFLTKPPATIPPKNTNTNTIPPLTTTTTTTPKPFDKQPITAQNFNLNDLDDGHELSGVATSLGLGGFNFDFSGFYDSRCGCIQTDDSGEVQFRDVKKLVNVDNGEVLFNYL